MKLSAELAAKCLALAGAGPRPLLESISEKDFQAAVEYEARRAGWLAYHTRDSRKSAAGFPDLVLVRLSRVLWRELKIRDEQPTAAQKTWIEALELAGQDVAVWRPEQWPEIVEALK